MQTSPKPWRIKTEFSCHVQVVDANGNNVFKTYCDRDNNGMENVVLILELVNATIPIWEE